MASLKAADDKIRKYWEYIDRSNVMEMLMRALSDLFNEPVKPPDILVYIREKLGDDSFPNSTAESLKRRIREATEKLKILEEEVDKARSEARYTEERFKFCKEKKAKMLREEAAFWAKKTGQG